VRLLALEQSTKTVSAALSDGRERRVLRGPRGGGGESLLGFIDRLLAEAGLSGTSLDALVCGIGPGSYTGVRVALGLAQGLARAWDCPLLGLTGTEALARRALEQACGPLPVLVALEAGLGEAARLWFRPGREVRVEDHALLAAQALQAEGAGAPETFVAVGSALPKTAPPDWRRCRLYLPDEEATAEDYLPLVTRDRLANAPPPMEVSPLYLRPAVTPRA
jgi:tRNA threonylcarbamoyladenosine biosynthesis protein TsaB